MELPSHHVALHFTRIALCTFVIINCCNIYVSGQASVQTICIVTAQGRFGEQYETRRQLSENDSLLKTKQASPLSRTEHFLSLHKHTSINLCNLRPLTAKTMNHYTRLRRLRVECVAAVTPGTDCLLHTRLQICYDAATSAIISLQRETETSRTKIYF